MPLETALAYLRTSASDDSKRIPPVVVIFGPHAFLREYVLDSVVRKLISDGCQHRSFQIGSGDDYGAVLNEISAPDLFAPRRAIACRILKSRRDKAETAGAQADAGDARASGSGGSETALGGAIATARGPVNPTLVYANNKPPPQVC